jgi:hypothetical protein
VLNRKASTKAPPEPVGSPKNPIGRGQPLPPPGTPLPLPERRNRSSYSLLPAKKEAQKEDSEPSNPEPAPEHTSDAETEASRPKTDRSSSVDDVLVVEAPPDSAPSTPTTESPAAARLHDDGSPTKEQGSHDESPVEPDPGAHHSIEPETEPESKAKTVSPAKAEPPAKTEPELEFKANIEPRPELEAELGPGHLDNGAVKEGSDEEVLIPSPYSSSRRRLTTGEQDLDSERLESWHAAQEEEERLRSAWIDPEPGHS